MKYFRSALATLALAPAAAVGQKLPSYLRSKQQKRTTGGRSLVLAGCPGEEDFSVTFSKHCNYINLRDKIFSIKSSSCTAADADSLIIDLVGAASREEAEAIVTGLCEDAYANSNETFAFSEITRKGNEFDNEYYSGGTYWNYEIQTDSGKNILKNDASRVRRIYNYEAQHKMIDLPTYLESFDPEGNDCDHNAAFCCWVQDRQAGDNNGNCNTPYDSQCIDKDPGDNANFCYTDHSRSTPASHVSGGFSLFSDVTNDSRENIEGPIHCHGFAWADDVTDVSNVYRGNNLFFVSMYDHMHQRGYVRNAPGSAMCGCAENMAVVTRADCTEISAAETFKFDYDSASATVSGVLTQVRDLNFNSCQGANNRNNDLEAYMQRLVNEGRVPQEKLDSLRETLVGATRGNCNRAVESFMATKGYVKSAASMAAGDAESGGEPVVEAIDITYDKASEGGDGANMPEVPSDTADGSETVAKTKPEPVEEVSEGTDETVVTPAEASAETETGLKDAGESCSHKWECMSNSCLGSGVCGKMTAFTTGAEGECVAEGVSCNSNMNCCSNLCGGKPRVCGGARM
uniref:Uncharacterized protein n=1 Tax=Trieres chinensis TaxID=1514140 RepID=A0A7S1ZGD6_TRICV